MLICWCIGIAASGFQEFYTLPAGGYLWQYDRLAVMTVVKTMNSDAHLCDIMFSTDLRQFNEDFLRLTQIRCKTF
jgi:chloramphenicol O-acetyltransferase type A